MTVNQKGHPLKVVYKYNKQYKQYIVLYVRRSSPLPFKIID